MIMVIWEPLLYDYGYMGAFVFEITQVVTWSFKVHLSIFIYRAVSWQFSTFTESCTFRELDTLNSLVVFSVHNCINVLHYYAVVCGSAQSDRSFSN